MSFFEPLPEPEPEDDVEPEYVEWRAPPWSGAPQNEVPAVVPLDVTLARTDALAVFIASARVFTTGLTFELTMIRRRAGTFEGHHGHSPLDGAAAHGDARFGVALADGRRATLDAGWGRREEELPEIVLETAGAEGFGRHWTARMWMWPVPPAGPLTFAFAWLDEGIDEALVEVDSAPLRAGAARAVVLWPDERPVGPSYGPIA